MTTATECWDEMQNKFAGLRRNIAKHLLENELASIIRTVAGHKRNKLPSGSLQYQSLWRTADAKVQKFCDRYHVDRTEVEAQIPTLKELKDLAKVVAAPNRTKQIAIGCLTGTMAFIALGFSTGVIHWLFALGYNWAQYLPHI